MFKLGSALFITAFVCALVLGALYQKTAPAIEQQKQALLEQSLQSVLPAHRYVKEEAPQGAPEYYTAYDETGTVSGWCLLVDGRGYAGNIRILAGVDPQETISGIKVLEHKETPGLGSKIADVEPNQAEPAFLAQFRRKRAEDLVLTRERKPPHIQAVTGATISSRAVTRAVKEAVEDFFQNVIPQ